MYQDVMACVVEYGSPTFLITFTANTNWKDIRDEVEPNQAPANRPDLIDRVFAIKLDALLDDIMKKEVLGPFRAIA